jgi:hypothetical protein
MVGVAQNSVTRYVLLAGAHAESLHRELVALSLSDSRSPGRREVGFVFPKEPSCDPNNPLDHWRGEDWDHTAVDPESCWRWCQGNGIPLTASN